MLNKDQREKIQNAVRLLQLDGDRDVWEKVAEDLHGSGIRVPFLLSDMVRELKAHRHNLARAEEQVRNYQEMARQEAVDLEQIRAKLMVGLADFLLTDGSE
jgi:hypothetical protein